MLRKIIQRSTKIVLLILTRRVKTHTFLQICVKIIWISICYFEIYRALHWNNQIEVKLISQQNVQRITMNHYKHLIRVVIKNLLPAQCDILFCPMMLWFLPQISNIKFSHKPQNWSVDTWNLHQVIMRQFGYPGCIHVAIQSKFVWNAPRASLWIISHIKLKSGEPGFNRLLATIIKGTFMKCPKSFLNKSFHTWNIRWN